MLRYLFRFLLVSELVWPVATWSLTLEPGTGTLIPADLGDHQLAARCVSNDQESIEQVAAPSAAHQFVAIPALLLKGYTSQTCWLRFEVQRTPNAPQDWLLEVGMPYLDDVTLFVPTQEGEAPGGFTSLRLGDHFPFADRPLPHRLFVFPLRLSHAQPVTAYLRIKTSSTMLVETLRIWQYAGLLASTQMENGFYWLVFGMVALGLLSNLLLWIWLREGIYRSYALYLAILLASHLVNSGIATPLLWQHAPVIADRAIGVLACLMFLVGLLFFNEVLGLRRSFPRAGGRLIPIVLGFYGVCTIAALAGYYAQVAPFVQLVVLLVTIGITIAGPWLLWRGEKALWLYVLAFSTQLVSAIAFFLRNLGLWPVHLPLDHFVLGATAIHVTLLHFALAERVRNAQQEKHALAETAARLEAGQLALKHQQEFMSMVAHEFRTPLTIIDTSAQRIVGQPLAGADKTAERCDNIRAAVHRLTRLMDEFLTVDRMEGQIRQFAPMPCRVDQIIEAALAEFPPRQIEVHRAHLPETLLVDAELLQVALTNLLSNALRFSPPGRAAQLRVEGLMHGGAAFTVTDDGPGVPVEERGRVFEKYFRGRASQGQPGAGLGLYLVDQIAKLHGGKVELQTAANGRACSFTLTIPSASEKFKAASPMNS